MITYAGIGSREITEKEENLIKIISSKLSSRYVLFSGNAPGADISFQIGSNNKCVIYLPWSGFNKEMYNPSNSIAHYDVGDTDIGKEYANKYHPCYGQLKVGAKRLMCRNSHQVLGYKNYPRVDFVVFCAKEVNCEVFGGTSQAVRLARGIGIPTFNIRYNGSKELREYLTRKHNENS
jgi:hypothetical protein